MKFKNFATAVIAICIVSLLWGGGPSLAASSPTTEYAASEFPEYTSVLRRVQAGETVYLAVDNEYPPDGFVRVKKVPKPLRSGLWKCWLDGAGDAVFAGVEYRVPTVTMQPILPRPLGLAPYPFFPNVQQFLGNCPGGRCPTR